MMVSKIYNFYFHPLFGEMIQLSNIILFRWVGSTTTQGCAACRSANLRDKVDGEKPCKFANFFKLSRPHVSTISIRNQCLQGVMAFYPKILEEMILIHHLQGGPPNPVVSGVMGVPTSNGCFTPFTDL